ncbi:unnamed protein product [Schistosoma mattheei]|uniref:Uncharacterized protein n=1 Tax=Schistosoma mattheei TaxID=31246 RepID=A0A3P8JF96_9TREM|nr:unnamed protein product [Schistosoma mattheei]
MYFCLAIDSSITYRPAEKSRGIFGLPKSSLFLSFCEATRTRVLPHFSMTFSNILKTASLEITSVISFRSS